jgi:hypothetical protein
MTPVMVMDYYSFCAVIDFAVQGENFSAVFLFSLPSPLPLFLGLLLDNGFFGNPENCL